MITERVSEKSFSPRIGATSMGVPLEEDGVGCQVIPVDEGRVTAIEDLPAGLPQLEAPPVEALEYGAAVAFGRQDGTEVFRTRG